MSNTISRYLEDLEFSRPYDERLLNRYGGIVHSCGKVDHFVPLLPGIEGYHAFNLSQPHYNDMESIYRNTVDKGIPILGLDRGTADQAVARGGLSMVWLCARKR